LSSFLAATIVPLSSEIVLSFLLLNNYDFGISITIATIGNVLGSVTNYYLGYAGSSLLQNRWFKLSQKEMDHALTRYKKHGTASLLLAWVPVIGDPLTVVSGILKINIYLFLLLVTIGKLGRYWVIGLSILAV